MKRTAVFLTTFYILLTCFGGCSGQFGQSDGNQSDVEPVLSDPVAAGPDGSTTSIVGDAAADANPDSDPSSGTGSPADEPTGSTASVATGYHAAPATDFPYYDAAFAIMGGFTGYVYANVKDFGEAVDGDWGPVIQRAVDSLGETGGVVCFPQGTYTIGTQVVVPFNVYILGHGRLRTGLFLPQGELESLFLLTGKTTALSAVSLATTAAVRARWLRCI